MHFRREMPKLTLKDDFRCIWVPSWENRYLRQPEFVLVPAEEPEDWRSELQGIANTICPSSYLAQLPEASQCTMLYETYQRFLGTTKCVAALLTLPPRLQRNQSPLRKCSPSPDD
jgi:hypothetical protein